MLNEEIIPKIEQLDRDKQNFQKWKTTQNEINSLDKIIKANDFYNNTKSIEIKVKEVGQFKSQRNEMQGNYNKILKEKESLDKIFGELINNKKINSRILCLIWSRKKMTKIKI